MLSNTPPRVIVGVVVALVVLIVAEVVLILAGHDAEAIALPATVVAIVPPLLGQSSLHNKTAELQGSVDDAKGQLADLLNGGTEQAVRRVVRTELATLVATDERDGSTHVADAGAGLPPATANPPFSTGSDTATGTGGTPAGGHYAG